MGGKLRISRQDFARYLEVFHTTYRETVDTFVEQSARLKLERYSAMQGTIIGYLSLKFGAGYEYRRLAQPQIFVRVAYQRIDYLFTQAPPSVQKARVPIIYGRSHDITFKSCEFTDFYPIKFDDPINSVKFISTRIRVGSWRHFIEYAEIFGDNSAKFWSVENAIRRAKDEVIVAVADLATAARASLTLEEYLKSLKEKTVLVLGDFGDAGRKRIEAIKETLKELGYNPVALDDIPESPLYDLTQKALAVGSVARFVVMDDSSKSGHLVEFPHIQMNRWLFVILREKDSEGTFMTRGASLYSNVVIERDYTQLDLKHVLIEVATWAETKVRELSRAQSLIYPWRKPSD